MEQFAKPSNADVPLSARQWLIVAGIALVALVVVASGAPVPGVPDWLDEWTTWVAKVVALVVGPKLLFRAVARVPS